MCKTISLLISGVTLILSTSALAELEFEKAGFSIGTVHDEHAEFFDKENVKSTHLSMAKHLRDQT